MKKVLVVMVGLAMMVSLSSAEIMNWTSWDDLGADVEAVTGTGGQLGWGVQLYLADTARTAADTGWYNSLRLDQTGADVSGADTMVAGAFTPVVDDGGWFIIDQPGVSTAVGEYYSVMFDAATIAAANNFVVLDSSTFFLKTGDGTIGPAPTYNSFKTYESDLQWQAIPEPATIGLMGIAGLGMFLARKKTRR